MQLRLCAAALALLTSAACVTSGDLTELADQVARAEAVAADRYATQEEVEREFRGVGDVIEDIGERVADRAEGWWQTAEGMAGAGGLFSILTGLGVNMYRNSRRRRRGEPVTEAEARPPQ